MMTAEQYARIEAHLPTQRGNVSHQKLNVIDAILFFAENGCRSRALPKRFGNWHTLYTRMNRWAKAGVLDRLFAELQREQLIRIKKGQDVQTLISVKGRVRVGVLWSRSGSDRGPRAVIRATELTVAGV